MKITGKTQAQVDAEAARLALEAERTELQAKCDALDLKAVRPLRAIKVGTGTEGDATRLAEIEVKVATIRARIAEIDKIIEFCDKNL